MISGDAGSIAVCGYLGDDIVLAVNAGDRLPERKRTMNLIDVEKDFMYFKNIWESKGRDSAKHSMELWNKRAEEWEKELDSNAEFKQSLSQRVDSCCDYLLSKGLLQPDQDVLDIGCGTGRFVVEFAKRTHSASGLDLSPNMIRLAEDYSKEQNITNTSFFACDFKSLDVGEYGWHKKFDLVFTSITPAIGTYDCLEKLGCISKGYCFNSSFIHRQDDVQDRISRDVFRSEGHHSKRSHMKWYYSLFNLLLFMGYLPVSDYYKQDRMERIRLDELSVYYYAKPYFRENADKENERIRQQVYDYLRLGADKEGYFIRNTRHWYGWILWNVNERKVLF